MVWKIVALIALLAVIAPVAPTAAFADTINEFEGRRTTRSIVDFRGTAEIRGNPATVTDVSYVHPQQIILEPGEDPDFLAIGTYNGAGTDNTNAWWCADEYGDTSWSIYTDGVYNGAYFCRVEQTDAFTTGDVAHFRMFYGQCNPYMPDVGWKLNMGGINWECYVREQYPIATEAVAMLETVSDSTTDRNIDVKFRSLEVQQAPGPPWVSFGQGTSIHTNNYSYTYQGIYGFDAYLSPMN